MADFTNTPTLAKAVVGGKDYYLKDAEARQRIVAAEAALAQEVSDRQAGDNALDARLDIIEGEATQAGSIKKALADAEAYTDAAVEALDIDDIEVTAGKTVKVLSEANGKVSLQTQDIEILTSQVTDAGTAIDADILVGNIKDSATSADLASSKQVADYVAEAIQALGAGVEFIGTTELATGETIFAAISRVVTAAGAGHPKKGDLVIIQNVDGENSEYICTANSATSMEGWELLGNTGLYATKAALEAEETRAEEAEADLDGRLDVLEGADTVSGSVANSIKVAIEGLDAEKSQAAGADGLALSITEVDGKITAISGSIAAEVYDAYGDAAQVKTDLLGDAATDYNTLGKLEDKIQAEAAAARAAEEALEDRLDVVQGDATTAGSIKKAVADEAARIDAITGDPDTGKTLQDEIDDLEATIGSGVVHTVAKKSGETVIDVDNTTDPTNPKIGMNVSATQGTAVTMTKAADGLKVEVSAASTSAQGIVQLSSAVDSASEVLAATPKAVKTVQDALDVEEQARADADSGLDTRIKAFEASGAHDVAALEGRMTAAEEDIDDLESTKLDIADVNTKQFAIEGIVVTADETTETLTFTAATKESIIVAE